MNDTNPVNRAIAAAGNGDVTEGRRNLSAFFDVKVQALDGFRRKGYFPLDRAKAVAERYGLPLRELVRPDIRAAMDVNAASSPMID